MPKSLQVFWFFYKPIFWIWFILTAICVLLKLPIWNLGIIAAGVVFLFRIYFNKNRLAFYRNMQYSIESLYLASLVFTYFLTAIIHFSL